MNKDEVILGKHYGYRQKPLLNLEEIIVLRSEGNGNWRVQKVDSNLTEVLRSQTILMPWEKRDLFLKKESEDRAQEKLLHTANLGKKYAYRRNSKTVGTPLEEVIVLEIIDKDNYLVRFADSGESMTVPVGRLVVEWENVEAFRKEDYKTLQELELERKLVEASRPHWSGESYDPIRLAVDLVFNTLGIDASFNI